MPSASERVLPLDPVFAPLFPDRGLRRGQVISCRGPAATTLALALTAPAMAAGSWMAVIGVDGLGVEAAAELGIPLNRLVAIDRGSGALAWAERVGAAVDGFDFILTAPPTGAGRFERKVRQRIQARGVVALTLGRSEMATDLTVDTARVTWMGLNDGAGRLTARRAIVRVGGRRAPRPRQCDLWLPGPSGRVALVDEASDTATDEVVEVSRAEVAV